MQGQQLENLFCVAHHMTLELAKSKMSKKEKKFCY